MNKRNLERRNLITIGLIILSIVLLGLGFYHLYQQHKYVNKGEKISAVVENILKHPSSDVDNYKEALKEYNLKLEEYREMGVIGKDSAIAIIISYQYNGKEYLTELGYFSDEIRIAQEVIIYINKDNPRDFIYEGSNKFGLYFCMTVGGVMLLFSLIFFFVNKRNNNINKLLVEKGQKIEAEILYVDEDEKKLLFNKHPYVFTCVYKTEDGQEKIFVSDSIYCKLDGTNYIGKKINVYVEQNNYDNYYVDTKSFE